MLLEKPNFRISYASNQVTIHSDKFAYGVKIDVPDGVMLEDNYFNLLPGETRIIRYTTNFSTEDISLKTRITSLFDTY